MAKFLIVHRTGSEYSVDGYMRNEGWSNGTVICENKENYPANIIAIIPEDGLVIKLSD